MSRSFSSMKPAAAAAQPEVAVEHRDDDGHVGAADGHHQVDAETPARPVVMKSRCTESGAAPTKRVAEERSDAPPERLRT